MSDFQNQTEAECEAGINAMMDGACPLCGSVCFDDVHTPATDHPELTTTRKQCSKCEWFGEESPIAPHPRPTNP